MVNFWAAVVGVADVVAFSAAAARSIARKTGGGGGGRYLEAMAEAIPDNEEKIE